MSRLSRSRMPQAASEPRDAANVVEHVLTVPEALLAWAAEPARAIAMARPYAAEVTQLLSRGELSQPETEVLLNRLEAIASEAVREGRADLLVGLDVQTAEWLGLTFVVEAAHGPMEVGPDPATQAFPAREPEWTFGEVAVVAAAGPDAVDLAVRAKALLAQAFGPDADEDGRDFTCPRIRAVTLAEPESCIACAGPLRAVSVRSSAGAYCVRCWSELTSRLPSHLVEILQKAPKSKRT